MGTGLSCIQNSYQNWCRISANFIIWIGSIFLCGFQLQHTMNSFLAGPSRACVKYLTAIARTAGPALERSSQQCLCSNTRNRDDQGTGKPQQAKGLAQKFQCHVVTRSCTEPPVLRYSSSSIGWATPMAGEEVTALQWEGHQITSTCTTALCITCSDFHLLQLKCSSQNRTCREAGTSPREYSHRED